MSHTSRARKAQTLAAAAALCAGGLLAAPTAHAANCTVSGDQLHISSGGIYSITVNANGSTLGPRAVLLIPGGGLYGNVSGSIAGTAVNFIVDWDEWTPGNKAKIGGPFGNHFRGDIGADGIASGTSVGSEIPGNLYKPGEWHTTDKLNCEGLGGGAAAGGGPTINEDVRLFDKPNGNDLGVDLKKGDSVTLNGPCPIDNANNVDGANGWCVVTDTTLNLSGAVWGESITKRHGRLAIGPPEWLALPDERRPDPR